MQEIYGMIFAYEVYFTMKIKQITVAKLNYYASVNLIDYIVQGKS